MPRRSCATGLVAREEIAASFVIRRDWGYPIYVRGFEKTLEAVWPFLGRLPNLLSAGRQGLFNHNNIDHCLVMGRSAAEAVREDTSPARAWYDNLGQFSNFRIFDCVRQGTNAGPKCM